MSTANIPKVLQTKKHLGTYMPLYAILYVEEKAKKENKAIGEVIAQIIKNQKDFKKEISSHLEFLSDSL